MLIMEIGEIIHASHTHEKYKPTGLKMAGNLSLNG